MQQYNSAYCLKRVWILVSYIKGSTWTEGPEEACAEENTEPM